MDRRRIYLNDDSYYLVEDTNNFVTRKMYGEKVKCYENLRKCIVKLDCRELVAIEDPNNDKETAYVRTYKFVPDPEEEYLQWTIDISEFEKNSINDTFQEM